MNQSNDTVSKDGVAGARICCVFLVGILVPWVLGCFNEIVIDVLMIGFGGVCIFKGRNHFRGFLQENNWEKTYWYVFVGCTLLVSGVYSVLSCYGIAPCGEIELFMRAIIFVVGLLIMRLFLPPNSIMIQFVSSNYKKFDVE